MTKHRIADKVFGAVASLVIGRPWLVIGVYGFLTIVSCLVSSWRLALRTDQNDLMSSDLPFNERYQKFLADFGDLEFLYVVIRVNGDPDRAMLVADAVAGEMSRLEEHIESVFHRIPLDAFEKTFLRVRVENHHLRDSQSSTATGSVGFSYLRTEPRSAFNAF